MKGIMQAVGLIFGLLLAVSPLKADIITLSTTNQIEDVQLRSDTATGNFGAYTYMLVGRVGVATNNSLMRFTDLSAAAGQTVTNATLRLYRANWANQTADVTVNIYQVAAANADWVEGDGAAEFVSGASDWRWKIQSAPNTAWAGGQDSGCGVAGTDYTTNLVGSVIAYDGAAAFLDINLDVSVVQNWIDNPSQNYGLVLAAPGATAAGQVVWFNSSEAASGQPELTLNTIPEPATIGILGIGAGLVMVLRRMWRVI